MAKLYFRYGAMNSGQTTLLMAVAHNYEERDMFVKVLKPDFDSNDILVSKLGVERKVDLLIKKEDTLKEYLKSISKENISCVLVDAAQFLNKEQVDELFLFTKKYNIPVICYGLRTDFKSSMFEGSKRLFEVADIIEELVTICRCGKRAKFNGRKVNDEFVLIGNQIAIDKENNVTYESLCGKCYIEKVLHINLKEED